MRLQEEAHKEQGLDSGATADHAEHQSEAGGEQVEKPVSGAHDESHSDGSDHSAGSDSHSGASHDSHEHHGATYNADDSVLVRLDKGMKYYLDTNHLFEHVQDATYFEVPKFLSKEGKIHLPRYSEAPLVKISAKEVPVLSGRITKFMVLEVAAAVLIFVVFRWLALKISSGQRPTGKAWNLLEFIVVFIRDEIVRPAIGKKDSARFMPFLLTTFFFILTLNLFGMVPMLGSATGSISVTAVLALATFVVVVGSGMKKMGVVEFLKSRAPHLDLPPVMAVILIPGIWLIEIFGLFVKHFVLAVRLFANMFAGHLVLAFFLGFIGVVSATWLLYPVAPVVIVAKLLLSLLELFVAFLQAYVFTFLAALFIGEAQHAH